jgi:2-polyprenyl-3-methyl-5-hydroxy-6-metoxy-1,4-benzoquinol methylase
MFRTLVNREEFLLTYCRSKNILHLCCCDSPFCHEKFANGNLFHIKLLTVARKVVGIDLDEAAINFLKQSGINNLIVCNVEKLKKNIFNEKFNIILAGEILEHLSNPGLFMNGLTKIVDSKTEIIITVPNTPTIKNFLRSLLKKEIVHKDHVCYYSINTLSCLLNRYNIFISDCYYYCAPPVLKSGLVMRILNKMAEYICRLVPNLGDGIIVICRMNNRKS